MKFSELLVLAIQRSEIPLRFEPGAEEAVARPVSEFIRVWLQSHVPDRAQGDFDYGRKALIGELLEELDDRREVAAG
ncbi:MAG: hypothetical protein ACRD44_07855 [Bryobacteraceae bacterium]